MSTQFFLDETDIDTLINLLLRSQQSRTREALCFSIGIDPKRLSFIRDSSESDFFLLLINYLNEIGEKEALCKLCCKELSPIFHHGKYATVLSEIAAKLNCNQRLSQNFTNNQQPTVLSSSPVPSVSVNPLFQLAKNKLVIGSAIFIIGLAGFVSFTNRTPNVNQQISGIYEEVLKREPTDSERKYYVDLLENRENRENLNSIPKIHDWITKTSSLLHDGNVISLECQGDQDTGFKWLDSRIKNNNVSLASNNIDAHTKWKVHVIDNGVVALENQGVINGSKWLDGVFDNETVNLAPFTGGDYIGTKWRINIIGDGVVALDNQGESRRWLNGVTKNGSVDFAPHIGNDYTGTKWKISKQ